MRRLAILISLCAAPASAEAPRLALPVDCKLGDTCFVQNYVDQDPGPGTADFTCGPLSYDGHKGTDFALLSLAAMQAGVEVLAAAPGTVLGTRDRMPDIAQGTEGAPDLNGQDCGNGLVIDHGNGWQTQYCHMKRGSLRTTTGQTVATGDVLGQVGLSGRTQFPHLHISLRKDGETVDPFQPDTSSDCNAPAPATLWLDDLTYIPGGLIATGFWPALPDYDDIKAGRSHTETLTSDAEALVLWGYVFGGRDGDRMDFRITGPGGSILTQTVDLTRTQAQLFRATGKRRTAPWPTGVYDGTVTLIRNGTEIGSQSTTVLIAN